MAFIQTINSITIRTSLVGGRVRKYPFRACKHVSYRHTAYWSLVFAEETATSGHAYAKRLLFPCNSPAIPRARVRPAGGLDNRLHGTINARIETLEANCHIWSFPLYNVKWSELFFILINTHIRGERMSHKCQWQSLRGSLF